MKARLAVLVLTGLCLWTRAADAALARPAKGVTRAAATTSSITSTASITIPQMLSYQGMLTDTLGVPVPSGSYQMTFRLYNVQTGGTAFWSETQTVSVKGGLFSAMLGAVTPITLLPDSGALYLGLQVQTSAELTPRLRIASAAYAYLAGRAADADLLEGKDTTALDVRYVNEGQTSSVTSNMVVDGTLSRTDVAANFKAPFADTSDYAKAAPATDSARLAGNSYLLEGKDTTALWNAKTLQGKDTTALWNAKKLQGKDTTGFVRAGQASSITSAMITDNTIVRADVATSFKAPFSDTADYAKAAPAADSARVAGNSHLLQGKDTTALWNAKTLQGKDTTGFVRTAEPNSVTGAMLVDATVQTADIGDTAVTMAKLAQAGATTGQVVKWSGSGWAPGQDNTGGGSGVTDVYQDTGIICAPNPITSTGNVKLDLTYTDARYVNEGQASSVTSNMVVDGTLSRSDVAAGFKAPFADTADYARAAPATDSARVAGNSYLLEGKDTTALWNAKKLQGKDTTGFVRTGQASSITSTMITDNTIVRSDVATSFKAPYTDTADYARAAPATDSARVAGNSYLLEGKDTTALWNAKTLQGKDTTALWNAKKLQGKDTTGFVRTGQVSSITSAMITDNTIVRADVATSFKAPFSDTADYAKAAPAADSARVAGNSHLLEGKDTTALWNAKTLEGKDTTALDARFVNEGQAAGGDLTGTYPNPTIAAGAVTGTKIAANAIDSTKIAAGTVTGTNIKDGSVTSADIRDTTVTTAKLKDGSVTAAKFALPYHGSIGTTDTAFRVNNTQTNDNTPAIEGIHAATDWYGTGVMARGGYKGLEAYVNPTGSNNAYEYYGVVANCNGGVGYNFGVQAGASGSGTNYGVYASASGSGTNYAGYFAGNVTVTGNLSKGGGSFQIDHPLDPLNKYLYHSFVESPDMMNIYNGNVKTDARGYATVTLPTWFEVLNRDYRYQLTVIDEGDGDGFAQAKVVRGVKDNSFVIRTSVPLTTVSWQVTGIRQDPYANTHRVQVEADKPAGERGRYLHPDAYGLPQETGIGYRARSQAPRAITTRPER